jgi:7-carboxy-7-deazaguanine synthase
MRINEIFGSVDGEVNRWGQGKPTLFIRLQGCNLRCSYCDTKYTWDETQGKEMEIDQILEVVKQSGFGKVTITGGEPLSCEGFPELARRLVQELRMQVSVETNGTYIIPAEVWAQPICWVVDYKLELNTPIVRFMNDIGSWRTAWVKIVIGSYDDFQQAVGVVESLADLSDFSFAFSPLFGKVSEEQLFTWMVENRFNHPIILNKAIVNTQLHKIIFPKGEKNFIFA